MLLFQRLGFGSVLGFIVAGILVGPYTPGPIASRNVEGLQGIAELGAFLIGMLLSASDFGYQIEAIVSPFKQVLMALFFLSVGMSFVVFDRDIHRVRDGRAWGHDVHFGDMYSSVTQEAAGLANAVAVYVGLMDTERAKGLAVTLHRLYPHLDIYLRVATLHEQEEMIEKGIKHAARSYVESTLMRGSVLLRDIGVSDQDIAQLVSSLRADNFALLRAGGHPSGGETHEKTAPSG